MNRLFGIWGLFGLAAVVGCDQWAPTHVAGSVNFYLDGGDLLADAGKLNEAIEQYTKAIKVDPKNALAYNNRGVCWFDKGDLNQALADYSRAIELYPDQLNAYWNRADVYWELNDLENSLVDMQHVIRLDPINPDAWYDRGFVLSEMGRSAAAIEDYRKAIALDANHLDSHNGLAWELATSPHDHVRNGAEALRLARRACELSQWQDYDCLDTLAAAHAECGEFAEAIRFMQRSIEAAVGVDQETIDSLKERAKLYDVGYPYHSDADF